MLQRMHGEKISRRMALKSGLMGGFALAGQSFADWVRHKPSTDEPLSYNRLFNNPPLLGIAETWAWQFRNVLSNPPDPASLVHVVMPHEVLPVYGAIHAPAPIEDLNHNDVWFDIGQGFIHSSHVVPVYEVFHEPEQDLGSGFWGEITVPFSWLHGRPARGNQGRYRLMYGSVYWVVDRVDDPEGRAWYRLMDDGLARAWWVEAQHMRRILPSELAPISPDVSSDRKRIEVSISQQRLTCLEDDVPVVMTRIATGTAYISRQGKQFGVNTPIGNFRVEYKRPSRHMAGGDPQSHTNHYDLPGVPWCTYFTRTGLAIHGNYWHNSYGAPGSHGCINVPTDAARWIYCWVNPTTSYDDPAHWTTKEERDFATQINISE